MQSYNIFHDYLDIERMNGKRQRVDLADLNLFDTDTDERDWFIIVRLREECRCDTCYGEGTCNHCGGNYEHCDICWFGECPDCEGSGVDVEWNPVYLDKETYDSIRQQMRALELIEARYNTRRPMSVRNWWVNDQS